MTTAATGRHAQVVPNEPTTCPGCGLVLPASDWPLGRKVNASPACWHLCSEVMGHEAQHLPALGRLHQLTVDAYGAQHAGVPTPTISTAFALVGLHLALEEGWSGTAVRAAHQALAERHRDWPLFAIPAERGRLTIAHVAASTTPDEHAMRVQAWAASVWKAWRGAHDAVRSWADAVLPPGLRDRLRSA